MKKKLVVGLMVLLTACTTGQVSELKDSFTGETTNTLDVGQITSEDSFGLMYEIRCKLVKLKKIDNSEEYYLKLYSYAESDGTSCPDVKFGSKAMFVVNGQNIELKTSRDSVITSGIPGFLGAACRETDIDVGPIPKELLVKMLNQKELKLRVYGSRFNLTATIDKNDLHMMQGFVK